MTCEQILQEEFKSVQQATKMIIHTHPVWARKIKTMSKWNCLLFLLFKLYFVYERNVLLLLVLLYFFYFFFFNSVVQINDCKQTVIKN